jgi:hypothetical protein
MEPEWSQDGARMEPGWSQDGARMEPGWSQNGARMEPDWSQDGARMEPKCSSDSKSAFLQPIQNCSDTTRKPAISKYSNTSNKITGSRFLHLFDPELFGYSQKTYEIQIL